MQQFMYKYSVKLKKYPRKDPKNMKNYSFYEPYITGQTCDIIFPE